MIYDVLCALHQLRLVKPVESELVTGVKRDISLLKRVNAKAGDEITVLDVSLDKNRIIGVGSCFAHFRLQEVIIIGIFLGYKGDVF